MSHDYVFIEQLTVMCSVGLYDWEHQISQKLVIDLRMACDVARCVADNDLDASVNYAAVSERVIALLQRQHIELIETAAELIAQLVLAEFAVSEVVVTVRKPCAVQAAQAVGVQITRRASQRV